MPLPSQIHRDRPLENISVAFKSDRLIAQELSPSVPVKHESDTYYVHSQDSLILPATLRANGGEANESDWNVSTSSYTLEEHALKKIVTDRDRNNADPPLRMDVDATEYLTEKILLRRETLLATLVNTTGTWANNTSLTSTLTWNTSATNPITQIDSAASLIAQSCGKTPNVVVLNDPTWRIAKENSATVDRIKYTSAESLSPAMLAKLFGVDKLLIGGGIVDTAEFGINTVTMGWIWTDAAFIGYVEPSAGLNKVSALYTFQGQEGGIPYKVQRWRDDPRSGDWIQVTTLFRHSAIATGAGYLINNTLT